MNKTFFFLEKNDGANVLTWDENDATLIFPHVREIKLDVNQAAAQAAVVVPAPSNDRLSPIFHQVFAVFRHSLHLDAKASQRPAQKTLKDDL